MRAGFWRQFKALTDRKMPVTLALNANVCNAYQRVASAALEAGFEFMGHGFVQGPMHKVENQADAIKRSVETISKFAGKPPRSRESPGLTETEETLETCFASMASSTLRIGGSTTCRRTSPRLTAP